MGYNILLIPPNDLLRHPIPNRLYYIASRLAKRHTIYLLSYPKHPLAHREVIRELDCIEIGFDARSTRDLGLYYILNYDRLYGTLKKLLSRIDIDVVIHGNVLPSYIVSRIAYNVGVPTVYDFLEYFIESATAYYTSGFTKKLCRATVSSILRKTISLNKAVVTVSHALKAIIEREYGWRKQVYIIPNGFESRLFKPIDRGVARRYTGFKWSYTLLYYGSIDTWIDFGIVLKALERLRDMDIVFLIIGFPHNIEFYKWLQKAIASSSVRDRVYIIKPMHPSKLIYYICGSDIVLAPYKPLVKNYGVPLKILESIACGKPVIAPSLREFKLWFRGYPVYYYRNLDSLVETIRWLLRNYPSREELYSASESVRKRFSWDTIAGSYEEVLVEVVEGRKR